MTTMGLETQPVEINNNTTLHVRSTLKAGKIAINHNEAFRRPGR